MLFIKMMKGGMMEAGIGCAWDVDTYAVPRTRGGHREAPHPDSKLGKSAADASETHQAKSSRELRPRGQPDHVGERRKLQAEEDCVVLLCRD